MAKKNQKSQKQQNQQPSEQPTTPAAPMDLTDEELGQVVGGSLQWSGSGGGGDSVQPNPTAVE